MDETEDAARRYAGQIRAARSLLGWTQRQLAGASCLPERTIARIELADGRLRRRNFAAVRVALGVAGVIVGDGAGGWSGVTEYGWLAYGAMEGAHGRTR